MDGPQTPKYLRLEWQSAARGLLVLRHTFAQPFRTACGAHVSSDLAVLGDVHLNKLPRVLRAEFGHLCRLATGRLTARRTPSRGTFVGGRAAGCVACAGPERVRHVPQVLQGAAGSRCRSCGLTATASWVARRSTRPSSRPRRKRRPWPRPPRGRWHETSQFGARRNALLACTALAQRRRERDDVEQLLSALERLSSAVPETPGSQTPMSTSRTRNAKATPESLTRAPSLASRRTPRASVR